VPSGWQSVVVHLSTYLPACSNINASFSVCNVGQRDISWLRETLLGKGGGNNWRRYLQHVLSNPVPESTSPLKVLSHPLPFHSVKILCALSVGIVYSRWHSFVVYPYSIMGYNAKLTMLQTDSEELQVSSSRKSEIDLHALDDVASPNIKVHGWAVTILYFAISIYCTQSIAIYWHIVIQRIVSWRAG